MHDGEDPGRRLRALALVGVGRAPDGEEGFLDGILGECAVSEDPEREAESELAEAVVQHAERVVVPAAHGFEHLLVGRLASRVGLGLLTADGWGERELRSQTLALIRMSLVGWSDPAASSSVTATVFPGSTDSSSGT